MRNRRRAGPCEERDGGEAAGQRDVLGHRAAHRCVGVATARLVRGLPAGEDRSEGQGGPDPGAEDGEGDGAHQRRDVEEQAELLHRPAGPVPRLDRDQAVGRGLDLGREPVEDVRAFQADVGVEEDEDVVAAGGGAGEGGARSRQAQALPVQPSGRGGAATTSAPPAAATAAVRSEDSSSTTMQRSPGRSCGTSVARSSGQRGLLVAGRYDDRERRPRRARLRGPAPAAGGDARAGTSRSSTRRGTAPPRPATVTTSAGRTVARAVASGGAAPARRPAPRPRPAAADLRPAWATPASTCWPGRTPSWRRAEAGRWCRPGWRWPSPRASPASCCPAAAWPCATG